MLHALEIVHKIVGTPMIHVKYNIFQKLTTRTKMMISTSINSFLLRWWKIWVNISTTIKLAPNQHTRTHTKYISIALIKKIGHKLGKLKKKITGSKFISLFYYEKNTATARFFYEKNTALHQKILQNFPLVTKN